MARLTEYDIRRKLTATLEAEHGNDDNTLVIQELGVCEGRARVDIAVLNGSIQGFEIKSPDDTLARLPKQIEWYGLTFDTVTIVYSGRKDSTVEKAIPNWWGMIRAASLGGACHLFNVRDAKPNPNQNPYHLAQLLWRDEVLIVLDQRELASGIRSKPRDVLWRRLAESVALDELKDIVRLTIKARVGWRDCGPSLPYVGEPSFDAT